MDAKELWYVRVRGKDTDFKYGRYDEEAAEKEMKRATKKRPTDKVTVGRWAEVGEDAHDDKFMADIKQKRAAEEADLAS